MPKDKFGKRKSTNLNKHLRINRRKTGKNIENRTGKINSKIQNEEEKLNITDLWPNSDEISIELPDIKSGFPLQFDNDISDEERRFYLKLFPSVDLVKDKKTHCTSCNIHLGTSLAQSENVFMHPILRVSQCKRCNEFYNSGEFSKGEDGSELYCRWCGQGGEVYCCAKCPFVFCKACISINLAKSLVSDIRDNENWNCFVCSPKIMWPIRATHWALKNFIEKQKRSIKNPNLSEIEKKRLFKKDSSTCCTRRKVGEESDSSNDSDIPLSKKKTPLKRKLTDSSTSSVEEPKTKLPTIQPITPKITSVTSTSLNKQTQSVTTVSSPPIVTNANLIQTQKSPQQFLINNNITVQLDNRNLNVIGQSSRPIQTFRAQNGNSIQGGQSAVKIVQLPQQNGPNPQQRIQIQLPSQQNTPPPLLIRNRAVQIRPHISVSSPPQTVNPNRTTTTTVQLGVRQTSENSPVYHNIGGFCIDLNSAAQHDSIRLPNGKLIQVKKSTTNNPTSTPNIRQQIPSGYLSPVQTQPQHQFTITQTSGILPTMPTPNTTVSYPTSQPIQPPQSQSIQTVPASSILPNTSGQVQIINGNLVQTIPASISNQTRAVLVRNVFPNTPIGKARTQLQNQLFSAMEICQHMINKLHTLTNSNPYKNANSLGDVKELYIHLSYLFTYGIGRLKNMQEKFGEDMTSMGFKNNVFNIAKGQPTAEKYSSDGDEDDIEIVEPKTTTINLDSDPEDNEEIISKSVIKHPKSSEKPENIAKNKLDNEIPQKQILRKVLPKPGIRLMTPTPWPKTQLMKSKLPSLQPIQPQVRPKLPNQHQLVNQQHQHQQLQQQQQQQQQQQLSHNQQNESFNQEINSDKQQPIMMITNDEEFNPLSVLAGMLEIELTEGDDIIKPPEPKKPRKKVTNRPNPNLIKKKALQNEIEKERIKTTDLKLKQRCTVNIVLLDKKSEYFTKALERFKQHNTSTLMKDISTVKNHSDITENSNKDQDFKNNDESKLKIKCTKPTNDSIENNEKETCESEKNKNTNLIKSTQNMQFIEVSDTSKNKENSEFLKSSKNENSKDNKNEVNTHSSKTESEKVFEETILTSDTKKNEQDSSLQTEKLDDNIKNKFKNANQLICAQTSSSQVTNNDKKLITDNIKESKQHCHIESKMLKVDKNEKSATSDVKKNFTQSSSNQSEKNALTNKPTKNNNESRVESDKLNEATITIIKNDDDQSEKKDVVCVDTEKTKNHHNEDSKKLHDDKEKITTTIIDKNTLTSGSGNEIEKINEEVFVDKKAEKSQDDSQKLNNNQKEKSITDDTEIIKTQFEKGDNVNNDVEKTEVTTGKLINNEKEEVSKVNNQKTNCTKKIINQSEKVDKKLMITDNIDETEGDHSEKVEKLNHTSCEEDSTNQSNKSITQISVSEKTEKKENNDSQETEKLSSDKKEKLKPIEKSDNISNSAEQNKDSQKDEFKKLIDDEKEKVSKVNIEKTNSTKTIINQSEKVDKKLLISDNIEETKGDLNEKSEKLNHNKSQNSKESKDKTSCEEDSANQSNKSNTGICVSEKTEKKENNDSQETEKLSSDKKEKLKPIVENNISNSAEKNKGSQNNGSKKLINDEKEKVKEADTEKINVTLDSSDHSDRIDRDPLVTNNLKKIKHKESEKSTVNNNEKLEERENKIPNAKDSVNQSNQNEKDGFIQEIKILNDEKNEKSKVIEGKIICTHSSSTQSKIEDEISTECKKLSDIPNEINVCNKKTSPVIDHKKEKVNEEETKSETKLEKNSLENNKTLKNDIKEIGNSENFKESVLSDSLSDIKETKMNVDAKENIIESEFSKRLNSINILRESEEEQDESQPTSEENKMEIDMLVSTNKLNDSKENLKIDNDNQKNLKGECESTSSNKTLTLNENYNSNEETTSINIKESSNLESSKVLNNISDSINIEDTKVRTIQDDQNLETSNADK